MMSQTTASRQLWSTSSSMQDFVAIDFETANYKRSSVCSIGVVIVRYGVVTHRISRLIHPTPNYYQWQCQQVHGLSDKDTHDAPVFPEVWSEIEPLIGDLPLVAHNASFDKSCLRAVHEYYAMPYPEYQFFCTYQSAKKRLGNILPNHQLHTVAEYIGHRLENHHDALEDAEACAAIAQQLL